MVTIRWGAPQDGEPEEPWALLLLAAWSSPRRVARIVVDRGGLYGVFNQAVAMGFGSLHINGPAVGHGIAEVLRVGTGRAVAVLLVGYAVPMSCLAGLALRMVTTVR